MGIGWGGGGLAKSGVLKQFGVYLRSDEAWKTVSEQRVSDSAEGVK